MKTGEANFTNQSSALPNESDTRRINLPKRIKAVLIGQFSKLIKKFSSRQPDAAQPARTGTVASTGAPNPQSLIQEGLLHAARRGIDAAKGILNEKIVGEQHPTEDALRLLTDGDKGIRRATTAAQNLKQQLRPEQLPAETLNGTPQQWAEQSRAISQMATQIGEAGFSKEASGRFLDYGTSGASNPFNAVVQDHPQLDHPVRNWLADGVNLLDQLLVAQEHAFNKLPPLSNNELTALKESVDKFAGIATDSKPPLAQDQKDGLESTGEDKFTDELIKTYDEKLKNIRSSGPGDSK